MKPRYRTYVLYRYIVGKSYGTGRQVSPLPRYLGACVYILVTILVTEEPIGAYCSKYHMEVVVASSPQVPGMLCIVYC